ncbi:MAG: hypothetical protein JOZ78_10085 [Chroococcidiopsidaceae cyanobacterium CP_BM_ER_R8_30]|nr:hypothetical protein [Chroococcidiopsidaceae cyanobacterium CP_BM_ER_R8_30]
MAIATVLLKTGEMVSLPDEQIAAYLEENRELIQLRKFKARRPRAVDATESATSTQ